MPDTFAYYVAAYVAAFLVYAGYAVTLLVRARQVRRAREGGSPTDGSAGPR